MLLMMKITYITSAIIPHDMTHPYQIMKTCEGFAKNKVKVDLILQSHPEANKKLKVVKNIWHYYGIKKRFKIRKIPHLFWINQYYVGKLGFLRFCLQTILFTIFFSSYSLIYRPDVYYVRDRDIFWASYLSFLKFIHRGRIYIEGHHPYPWVVALVKKSAVDGLIVITSQLKEYYLAHGVSPKKLFVSGSGVDLKMFDKPPSKTAIRKELNIPLSKKIVCYTGHLYDWKGVQVLALAMKGFINDDVICYFVGGLEEDVERFKKFIKKNNIQNIIVVGHVPPILVPKYQIAADVLVLPNIRIGLSEYTSPLKLYEYMASKRPIVASDLPALREVLDEKTSVLVAPNNPEALAKGIKMVIDDKKLAKKLSKNAYRNIIEYDWQERAKNIIKFIS